MILNSLKLVYGDGQIYLKMSAFVLTPAFTSVQRNGDKYPCKRAAVVSAAWQAAVCWDGGGLCCPSKQGSARSQVWEARVSFITFDSVGRHSRTEVNCAFIRVCGSVGARTWVCVLVRSCVRATHVPCWYRLPTTDLDPNSNAFLQVHFWAVWIEQGCNPCGHNGLRNADGDWGRRMICGIAHVKYSQGQYMLHSPWCCQSPRR